MHLVGKISVGHFSSQERILRGCAWSGRGSVRRECVCWGNVRQGSVWTPTLIACKQRKMQNVTIVNTNNRLTKFYCSINADRSINAINIIQNKNLISSLNRIIIEKSKKIVHVEKEKQLLKFPICLAVVILYLLSIKKFQF